MSEIDSLRDAIRSVLAQDAVAGRKECNKGSASAAATATAAVSRQARSGKASASAATSPAGTRWGKLLSNITSLSVPSL